MTIKTYPQFLKALDTDKDHHLSSRIPSFPTSIINQSFQKDFKEWRAVQDPNREKSLMECLKQYFGDVYNKDVEWVREMIDDLRKSEMKVFLRKIDHE